MFAIAQRLPALVGPPTESMMPNVATHFISAQLLNIAERQRENTARLVTEIEKVSFWVTSIQIWLPNTDSHSWNR
jgi:hypothetical protein